MTAEQSPDGIGSAGIGLEHATLFNTPRVHPIQLPDVSRRDLFRRARHDDRSTATSLLACSAHSPDELVATRKPRNSKVPPGENARQIADLDRHAA